MIDFMEMSLRKTVYENALKCSKQAGYFSNLHQDLSNREQRKIDAKFEKCIGKYSDSFENAMDIFTSQVREMNKSNVISHSQRLTS